MRPSVGTYNHLAFFLKILKSVTIVRVDPNYTTYSLVVTCLDDWLVTIPCFKREIKISFDNILLDIYLQYTFYSLRAMPVGTTVYSPVHQGSSITLFIHPDSSGRRVLYI